MTLCSYDMIKPPYGDLKRMNIHSILHPFAALYHFARHLEYLERRNDTNIFDTQKWFGQLSAYQRDCVTDARKTWEQWKTVSAHSGADPATQTDADASAAQPYHASHAHAAGAGFSSAAVSRGQPSDVRRDEEENPFLVPQVPRSVI